METSGERETIMNFSVSEIIKHDGIKILSPEKLTVLFEEYTEKKLEPDLEFLHDNRGRGFYALTVKIVNKKRQN